MKEIDKNNSLEINGYIYNMRDKAGLRGGIFNVEIIEIP
jgi:hypothetical protein